MDKELTVSEVSLSTHIRDPKQHNLAKNISYDPDNSGTITPQDLKIDVKPKDRRLTAVNQPKRRTGVTNALQIENSK